MLVPLRVWASAICQPRSQNQISLRLRRQAACGAAERAHAPIASPPSPSALSPKTQIRWLALARLRPVAGDAVTQQTRQRWQVRLAPSAARLVGTNECSPGRHTTHIVRSFPRQAGVAHTSVTTLFQIAPTLLTCEPLRRGNKATHNMALCAPRLLHCHADCSLTRRKVSAITAPVRRHRSRQRSRFA